MKIETAFLLASVFFAVACVCGAGDRFAVVIGAKSGEQSLFETNKSYCARTQAVLLKNGFAPENVKLFADGGSSSIPGAEEPSAASILAHLQKLSETLGSSDQLWLFLYGEANINQKGLSIATTGKRLRGPALAEALDKIPCKQFAFCMTRQSSGLMDALTAKARFAATATSEAGQMNPPLLPQYLLDALETNPGAPLVDIVKAASEKTKAYYEGSGLALAETAQIFDGEKVLQYPFDASNKEFASASFSQKGGGPPLPQARLAESAAPALTPEPDVSLAPRPATAETKALIAKAAEAAKDHQGFQAFKLEERTAVNVEKDCSTTALESCGAFLIDETAAERFGRLEAIDSPPFEELSILKARMIFPDGSFIEPKPETSPFDLKLNRRIQTLKFPGAKAGCLVQIEKKTSRLGGHAIPFFDEKIAAQSEIPSASTIIEFSTPPGMNVNFKVRNSSAKPEPGPSTPYAKTTVFNFGAVPAFEPLPYDPPASECVASVEASSLASWDELSAWANRVSANNDAVDESGKKLVAKLTQGAKNDADKLKALYEFLCELRYETTPVNARGLRPRTPGEVCAQRYGDCKDKANALVALAREAGIPGSMVLLNRFGPCDKSFPSWQFNHALAFFPKLEGYPDGLWCDATDGATPFGSLPPGDCGRDGLQVGQAKASFLKVALPNGQRNAFSENVELKVENGGVSGSLFIETSGLQDYLLRQRFKRLSPKQAQCELQKIVDASFAGLSVEKLEMSPLHELSKNFEVKAKLKAAFWERVGKTVKPPLGVLEAFSMENRDRPLVLFDGQPTSLRLRASVSGDVEFLRETQLEIPGATSPQEYPRVRETVMKSSIELK